ncbi:contractile injection system tape measure protein [Kordia sp.]|uniref:contractile injection system tape measure protein n=1 Tax=Kordia sp. TaxID=1965332 RepID=UPI003B5BCCE0
MHTIHDIAFEVDIQNDHQLVSWEQYYVDFFQDKLLPRVERICDDWDKKFPNTKCVIDSIDIHVEVDDINLESLQKEIIQQISKQLMSIQSDGSSYDGTITAKITREASPFDALLKYLSEGILPAFIPISVFKEWLSSINEFTAVEKNRLVNIFETSSEAIQRMLSLLRNDYKKFVIIVNAEQQITTQYIKLEETFFTQFLQAICKGFKLNYDGDQAKIWHKTLGFSSSLQQFSKTLLQLLTPKLQSEGKRLIKKNEKQLSIALLQAIIQYRTTNSITIETAKIGAIVKDISVDKNEQKVNEKSRTANETVDKEHKKTKDAITSETLNKEVNDVTEKGSTTQEIIQNQAKEQQTTKNQTKDKTVAEKHQSIENVSGENTQKSILTDAKTVETTNNQIAKITTNTSKEARSNLAKANTNIKKKITGEIGITTEKAGLIILHPFLMTFFKGVDLVTEENTISDIERACMLLHYLATENEEVTDVELTLEKILLGIPLETIVDYDKPLSDNDKNLCDELLKAVLEHWVVLKKSTVNTLRDMFLKRDGRMIITEENSKLTVERAAQDILLEKIPWTISLVRLRWMEKMMHIEW